MTLVVSPTQSDIQVILRSFLLSILPSGVECIAGQANRVPEPQVADFIVMTAINRERIATNLDTWSDIPLNGIASFMQATKVTIQLDVHGPTSAENAQILSTMLRDGKSVDYFNNLNKNITPLLADNPRQVAFINAEEQFETRWIVDCLIQANQTVTNVPQDFAAIVNVNLKEVDAYYPPV